MTETRPITQGVTPSVAVVIVAILATFVALAVIDSSVAVILAIFGLIFGGDLLRQLTAALEAGHTESASTTEDESDPANDPEDALERLRVRYADGELSETEFERRLEVLLETETVADVERYLDRTDSEPRGCTARELDRDLERSSN